MNERAIFVLPVLSDAKRHWMENRVSFVYYFTDLGTDGFLNYHHTDLPDFTTAPLLHDLPVGDTMYALPMFVDPTASHGLVNGEMAYWCTHGRKLEYPIDPALDRFKYVDNGNDCSPIMRWLDWCRKVRDLVIGCECDPNYNDWSWNLRRIESFGLRSITKTNHTHYNPYTLTGRPSNSFDGINYAAITKDLRRNYISRYVNGFLIEVDLTAFHLFLLHLLVGLEFEPDIYKSLSKYYPDDADPKDYTFKQIYGGIDVELLDISPFREISSLADRLHSDNRQGNLRTPLHNLKVNYKKDLNKWKVLNYVLQNMETEFNMGLVSDLMKTHHKLVLYTYDSFLFDVPAEDVSGFMTDIKRIFVEIPHKISVGRNYGEMKRLQGQ